MKKLVTLLIVMLAAIAGATAQNQIQFDKITLKTKKVIEAKVTEVGTEEIKYKFSNSPDAAIFTIKRMDVYKIDFADGHTEKFVEDIENPESYAGQKTMAVKIDFLSPLMGHTAFSFEKLIRPGMSWEGTLGIIGLGNDVNHIHPRGVNLKGGIRFLKTPDFKTGNLRRWHVLGGAYFKPELTFGAYSTTELRHAFYYTQMGDYNEYSYNISQNYTYGAINLLVGKQHVFSNIFLIDYYVGVGYGVVKTTTHSNNPFPGNNYYSESRNTSMHYGVTINQGAFPISFTAGLKLGVMIK